MLARNRTALFDAEAEDLLACRAATLDLFGVAVIEQNERVQIAIAGMKNVADGEPVFFRDLLNKPQRRRNLAARHHSVVHVIRRTGASHCSERVLSPLPKPLPLLG